MSGKKVTDTIFCSLFKKNSVCHFFKYCVLGMLVVWGLLLRVQIAYTRILWNDELWQIKVTLGTFKPVWLRNNYGDFSAFPGDYLLTYPLLQLFLGKQAAVINNHSLYDIFLADSLKWIFLLPQIVCSILAFVFLYLVCRRYLKTTVGMAASFVVLSFNMFLAFHSFEFRTYAFHPVLALASLYFTDLAYRRYETCSVWQKTALIGFFVFVAAFHLFGILFLLCALLFVGYEQKLYQHSVRREFLKRPAARAMIFIGIGCLAVWLWYFILAPSVGTITQVSERNIFQFFPDPGKDFGAFLRFLFVDSLLGNPGLTWVLTAIPLALICGRNERGVIGTLIGIYFVFGVGLILSAAFVKQYWFLRRQFIWTLPIFSLLIGWCVDVLMRLPLRSVQESKAMAANVLLMAFRFFIIGGLIIFFITATRQLISGSGRIEGFLPRTTFLGFVSPRPESLMPLVQIVNNDPVSDQDLKEQIVFLQNVLKYHDRKYPEVNALLGFCYERLGYFKTAQKFFGYAYQLKPDHFWYQLNYGRMLVRNGMTAQAEVILRQALSADVDIAVAFIQASGHYAFLLKELELDENDLRARTQEAKAQLQRRTAVRGLF